MALNSWMKFLKEYRAKNKGMSLKTAMKSASKLYKSSKAKNGDDKPKKRAKKGKKKSS